ncbi:hypothetical protein OHA40_10875 [Nocardia sp. NBC_00508]|nr:hypothetical protein [Nocardia sp. NBC_00508]WUD68561.1 hypothetical protein OHA40_10875 [Nocardia sp. NBC_00508]
MKPDQTEPARPAPPNPRTRPHLCTTNGALLGYLVLHSATWHRPR